MRHPTATPELVHRCQNLCREYMISRVRRWLGLKTARRLARQEDGTAAIEFGLVALPFLALVFAIIETALVFFASQTLETAACRIRAADHDRPGADPGLRPRTRSRSKSARRSTVCSTARAAFMSTCRPSSSFGSVSMYKPVDSNGNLDTSKFKYQAGRTGRYRRRASDLSMAGLRFAARSVGYGGQQSPDDRDRRIPQRALPMTR